MFYAAIQHSLSWQAALSMSNQSARSSGLRKRLQSFWDESCGDLIRQDDQEKIHLKKNSHFYQETACFKAGLCHCRNSPMDNLLAVWFEANLQQVMRTWFWSRGQNSEKERSDQRVLLEEGMVVTRQKSFYTLLCKHPHW